TGTGGTVRLMGHNNVRAENIQLTASEINVNATTGGGAGTIEFQTKSLTLSTNTDVSANSFSPGPAGTVTVRQADNVTIGTGSRVLTDAVITLGGTPQRPAGSILFETQQLTISGGGLLRSSALPLSTGNAGSVTVQGKAGAGSFSGSILIDGGGSGIFTNTQGIGEGGNITLTANEVTIQNGGTVSASTSGNAVTARGGTINMVAGRLVELNSGGSISASSTGPGNAGDIAINAGQQFEMRDSSVTAKATQASGGNIDIRAVDRIRLVNSEISSSVQGGTSTAGGNITIDPNVVVLQNSRVIAQAVQGAGGNITITTPLFLADSTSLVDASSQKGLNGTVTIQSPTSNLSESLGTLPSEPGQAQTLLTQRCAALANGQTSSFVVAGREQLPADPGGWLTSPLAFTALSENLDTDHAVASAPAVMAIASYDTGTVSLRRLTPVGFLMANFADSAATGCLS
ncbi:MAG: hypothetical protein ABIS18_01190, partial [Actinomycetota bacterium]